MVNSGTSSSSSNEPVAIPLAAILQLKRASFATLLRHAETVFTARNALVPMPAAMAADPDGFPSIASTMPGVGTALLDTLLHMAVTAMLQLQQQPVMQLPTPHLALTAVVLEAFAAMMVIFAGVSSVMPEDLVQKQKLSNAVEQAGIVPLLTTACSAVATELEQALKQHEDLQQQTAHSGMRSAFLTPKPKCAKPPRQQQQEGAFASSLRPVLSLISSLLHCWNAVVATAPLEGWAVRVFTNPALCKTVLPVAKLSLTMMRSFKHTHCRSSSVDASCDYAFSAEPRLEPVRQVEIACLVGFQFMKIIGYGPWNHRELLAKAHVKALLASWDIEQLMYVNIAWLAEQLYKQKKGQSAVPAANVLRALSNSSAAAVALGSGQQQKAAGSSNSSSTSREVQPHHRQVFKLLGLPNFESLRMEDKAVAALQGTSLEQQIATAFNALTLCMEISRGIDMSEESVNDAAAQGGVMWRIDSIPCSVQQRPGWQQLCFALVQTTIEIVQLVPAVPVLNAVMSTLSPILQRHLNVLAVSSAGETVVDLMTALGPAVLHAVMQQQRQQDQQEVDVRQRRELQCQQIMNSYGMLMINLVKTVEQQHLSAALEKSPHAFAMTLDVAMRTVGAAASPTQGISAVYSGKTFYGPYPPEWLLSNVIAAVHMTLDGMKASQLPVALPPPAKDGSNAGNSALVVEQHAPYVVSFFLSALKCAGAFRGTCPEVALKVAMETVACRVRGYTRTEAGAAGVLQNSPQTPADKEVLMTIVHSTRPRCRPATNRRIGDYAPAEVVLSEGLIDFEPGRISNSSFVCGGGSYNVPLWYEVANVASMAPWLIVGARCMWLTGQIIHEAVSSSNSSQQRRRLTMRGSHNIFVLETAFASVEWLGSELCHLQLPADVQAAAAAGEAGGHGHNVPAALRQLLQQHAALQREMFDALQRAITTHADSEVDLLKVWGADLASQLRDFAAAVTAALPMGWACNNAACVNLDKLSELQLVAGKGKKCGGCKVARYCGPDCQQQHWKAGHKRVCKQLQAAVGGAGAASQHAADKTRSRSTAANASTAQTAAATGNSRVSSHRVAAAAVEGLPGDVAAAAALSVRELKRLLTQLGVAGLAGAVEKSDLVQLLVAHLGLK